MAAELTPAQLEVLVRLRGPGSERPRFDPGLRHEVRRHLEDALAGSAARLVEPLVVNKTRLGRVHACEAHEVTERAAGFTWSARTARGTVAHKAIELSVHLAGRPTPLDLVDLAVERLSEGDDRSGLGDFLRAAEPAERAELRAEANDLVAGFLGLWPPLDRRWLPVTESSLRAELCGGRIVLLGKVDLTLGAPRGTEARRVVVDLKSSGVRPSHVDDLRFYALLETLRCGVPPFRLAGYALDAGVLHTEDVTGAVLEAAVRRTVDGVRRLVELELADRPPAVTPNPACRWCCAGDGCDGRRSWEEERLASLGA